jgi:hypothetical protein
MEAGHVLRKGPHYCVAESWGAWSHEGLEEAGAAVGQG